MPGARDCARHPPSAEGRSTGGNGLAPVRMSQWLMAMPVAVRTGRHCVMSVVVVSVVVAVRVFVLRRVVPMLVAVRFRQVQYDAGNHQRAARYHQPAGRLITQCQGQRRSDEGGEGEYRTCACGTEGSLYQRCADAEQYRRRQCQQTAAHSRQARRPWIVWRRTTHEARRSLEFVKSSGRAAAFGQIVRRGSPAVTGRLSRHDGKSTLSTQGSCPGEDGAAVERSLIMTVVQLGGAGWTPRPTR